MQIKKITRKLFLLKSQSKESRISNKRLTGCNFFSNSNPLNLKPKPTMENKSF